MQLSEYIQIACAIVGLAGITLARVRFTRRQQANPGVTSYYLTESRENLLRVPGQSSLPRSSSSSFPSNRERGGLLNRLAQENPFIR